MKGTKRVKLIAVALALILSIGILAGWAFTDVKGNISIDAKCGEENVEVASATATIEFTNADETKPVREPIALGFEDGSLIVPDEVKEDLALADEDGYTAKLTYTLNATGYDPVTGEEDMKALVEESNDENVPTKFKAISASFVKTQYKLTFSYPKGIEEVSVNNEKVEAFSEGITVYYGDKVKIATKNHFTCAETKFTVADNKEVKIEYDFNDMYDLKYENENKNNGKTYEGEKGWFTQVTVTIKDDDFDWKNYTVTAKLNGNKQTITKDSPVNFKTSGTLEIAVADVNDPTQTWNTTEEIEKVDGIAPAVNAGDFTVDKVSEHIGTVDVNSYVAKLSKLTEENVKTVKLIAPCYGPSWHDHTAKLTADDNGAYSCEGKRYEHYKINEFHLKIVDKAGNVSDIYHSTVDVSFTPNIESADFKNTDSKLFVREVEVTIKNKDGQTGKPSVSFDGMPVSEGKDGLRKNEDGSYSYTIKNSGDLCVGNVHYPIYRIDTETGEIVSGIIDNAAPVIGNIEAPKGAVNAMTVTVDDYCNTSNTQYVGAGVKNVYFAQITTDVKVGEPQSRDVPTEGSDTTHKEYYVEYAIIVKDSNDNVVPDKETGLTTWKYNGADITVSKVFTVEGYLSAEDAIKDAYWHAYYDDNGGFRKFLNDNRNNLGDIMTGKQGDETNQYVLELKGDGEYQLAIWAEDAVVTDGNDEGNKSNVKLIGGKTGTGEDDNKPLVNVDTRAPEFGAVSYAKENEYSIVHDQTISVPVTDNNGVKTVEISYTYNGEEKTALMSVDNGNYSYSFADGDGEYKVLSITATDITEPEANEATLEVNTAFTIDTKKPTMSHVLDPVSATLDKGYFNCDRKLTATVEELHFASGTFVYKDLEAGENAAPIEVPFTVSENRSVGNFANNVFTYTFDKDGKYELVSMTLTDKAGNSNTYTFDGEPGVDTSKAKESFTVDKTAPTVKVDYSNQSPANDKYFNADRTATITVTEHNFNGEKVNIVGKDFKVNSNTASGAYIIITQNDKDAKGDARNLDIDKAWTTNGDTHTLKITYTGSVNYVFDVVVVDRAGNVSATPDYAGNKDFAPNADSDFDVDKVAPKITITGVTNSSAYNGEVAGTVNYDDANFSSATIKLTRADKNGVYDVTAQHTTALPTGAPGGTVNLINFDRLLTNDGIYTLTATVVDMAGNTAENTVTFSVNRFGSTYKFDDYLASICDKHIKSVTDDLKITEINPDSITSGTVTITRNGKVIDSGDIAAVLQRSGSASGGWYEYLYTISKDLFKEDGMYKIVVSSKDAAGNEPNSENDEEFEIVFWVDDTPAEIAGIQGLEDAIINAENHTVKFTVRDNIGLKSVTVYCDSKEIAKFGEKDFTAGDLVDAQFTISEASSAQHIRIVAEDLSGNILDTDGTIEGSANTTVSFERDVTVSTNFFVRWFANKPLFFGSIAVIVAAGVGIYFIVAKKHKKEEATAE